MLGIANRNYFSFIHKPISILFLSIIFISFIFFNISSNAIIADSDSGFEYTNAQNILLYGKVEHGPVVQQFLYALIIGIFGPDYKSILVFQSILTILVVLITFQFVKEKTNMNIAVLVPFLFLSFTAFYFGNYTLKQYPLFLFLLTLSLYYLDKYINNKKNINLFLSAFFLGLSIMTHLLIIPFVSFVFLYYSLSKILRREKLTFKDVINFYSVFILVIFPYIMWRIIIDGMSLQYILAYPSNWFTIEYAKIHNEEFWDMSPTFTFEYYHDLYELFKQWVFIPVLLPFLILGLVKHKDKSFVCVWFLMLFAPYLVGRGVIRWNYIYVFIPLIVILSLVGLYNLLKHQINRKIITLIVFIIIVFSVASYSEASSYFEQRIARLSTMIKDMNSFDEIIPDGENILFRSREISTLLPNRNIIRITDLSEEDATAYVGWTNDSVPNIFKKYNISYVIVYKDIKMEKDFHGWYKIKTGEEPRHYIMIENSSDFRKEGEGKGFKLYKFINNSIQ